MSQLRITTMRVKAGAAARQAEQETQGADLPQVRRIQAGSAAHMAEEAKRAGRDEMAAGASFSLRAQGGRVQRVDPTAVTAAPSHPAEGGSTPYNRDESAKAGSAAAPTSSPEVAPGSTAHRADPSLSATGGLKSFLRGLFLPEEPS